MEVELFHRLEQAIRFGCPAQEVRHLSKDDYSRSWQKHSIGLPNSLISAIEALSPAETDKLVSTLTADQIYKHPLSPVKVLVDPNPRGGKLTPIFPDLESSTGRNAVHSGQPDSTNIVYAVDGEGNQNGGNVNSLTFPVPTERAVMDALRNRRSLVPLRRSYNAICIQDRRLQHNSEGKSECFGGHQNASQLPFPHISIMRPLLNPWQADRSADSFHVFCNDAADISTKEREYLRSVWDWEGEPKPLRLDNFVKILQIGQGAYGDVWLAEDLEHNRQVALKKLKFNEEREGFPKYFIREVTLLRSLRHKHIVKLLGVVFSRGLREEKSLPLEKAEKGIGETSQTRGSVWMVFEYLPFDLTGYTAMLRGERAVPMFGAKGGNKANWFTMGEIKLIVKQLLEALEHCHRHNIMHRDIKCANLLMTADGTIKLADFGLARKYHSSIPSLTNRVITLWYRPPELLLGADSYTTAVDIWSTGCIMGELLRGAPIFAGEKMWDVVCKIVQKLGKPTPVDTKPMTQFPLWSKWKCNPLNPRYPVALPSRTDEFRRTIRDGRGAGELGLDLLYKLLRWSPRERISAAEALAHPWFTTNPAPERLNVAQFPALHAAHSFVSRRKKQASGKASPVPADKARQFNVAHEQLSGFSEIFEKAQISSKTAVSDERKRILLEENPPSSNTDHNDPVVALPDVISPEKQKERAEKFRAAIRANLRDKHQDAQQTLHRNSTNTEFSALPEASDTLRRSHNNASILPEEDLTSVPSDLDREPQGSDNNLHMRTEKGGREDSYYDSKEIEGVSKLSPYSRHIGLESGLFKEGAHEHCSSGRDPFSNDKMNDMSARPRRSLDPYVEGSIHDFPSAEDVPICSREAKEFSPDYMRSRSDKPYRNERYYRSSRDERIEDNRDMFRSRMREREQVIMRDRSRYEYREAGRVLEDKSYIRPTLIGDVRSSSYSNRHLSERVSRESRPIQRIMEGDLGRKYDNRVENRQYLRDIRSPAENDSLSGRSREARLSLSPRHSDSIRRNEEYYYRRQDIEYGTVKRRPGDKQAIRANRESSKSSNDDESYGSRSKPSRNNNVFKLTSRSKRSRSNSTPNSEGKDRLPDPSLCKILKRR